MGELTAWSRDLVVTGDGKNLVSHTGAAALRMLADRVGLTGGLSAALAQPRLLVHDRGRVFGDLALVIADGASTIGGIDVLGESSELYGPVASVPTAWRTLAEIAEGGQLVTDRITRAINTTREHVWDLIHDRHGGLPGIRVADKQITGMVGVRLDATLVNVHSEKELASATWKKGFGFHPLLAYCDNTSESLAGLLRTGRAGSNTTADHLTVVDAAIAAVPVKHRRKLLITCDGAGASHGLVDHLHALNQRPGYRLWYTIGWELGERERQAITDLPEQVWQQAIDTAGQVRTSREDDGTEVEAAHVAEITGLLRSNSELATWPDDMRIIVRRELPHPGAQLSLFEQADGYRYQLFATNIPTRPAEPGMANAFLANLSYLDAANRSHARVEDRIRTGKDTGLDKFPSHRYELNTAWMTAALLAATLLAWFAQLTLDGPLAKAEPKTIRYRLLHVAARFTPRRKTPIFEDRRNLALGHPPGHRHPPHPSTTRRTLTHSPPSRPEQGRSRPANRGAVGTPGHRPDSRPDSLPANPEIKINSPVGGIHTRTHHRHEKSRLVLAAQTGLRITELTGLTLADIHLGTGAHVHCVGKGRKERATPLTRLTVRVLRVWLAERGGQPAAPLFPTNTGTHLSRDAVEHRLARHLATARAGCASLRTKRVGMHTLRHSAAMRLLESGTDVTVIALWLGHEQPSTTAHIYLHADMSQKERAIALVSPPGTTPGRYRPPDTLLAFLDAL